MIFSYIYRPVLYPVREASSSSRWEQIWRPTVGHDMERESNLGVSIKALHSELVRDRKGMDLEGRGGVEELRGEEEGETIIRMFCMRKESSIKKSKKKERKKRENLNFKDRTDTSNFKLDEPSAKTVK